MKKYFVISIIVFIAAIGAIVIAFKAAPEKQQASNNTSQSSDEIMYFYADTCHWCQQEKPIVEELEKEGVKFKKMNVGENRDLITQYNIEGTPTFIFKDKRLTGFQSKEAIRNLWEGKE